MVKQHLKSSILATVLMGTFLWGGTPPPVAGKVVVLYDNFEDFGALWAGWREVLGCPSLETQAALEGTQSLQLELKPEDCLGEEPGLICDNYGSSERVAVSFRSDLRGLQMASGSAFELLSLLSDKHRRRRALTVKLDQVGAQTKVSIEAMEDGESTVASPQFNIDNFLLEEEIELRLSWNRSAELLADGAASLELEGLSSSILLHIPLDDLANSTFTPDFVALGVGGANLTPGTTGGFLIDEFELLATPITRR